MIQGKLGLRGLRKSPQDIGTPECLWKLGGVVSCFVSLKLLSSFVSPQDSRTGFLSGLGQKCYPWMMVGVEGPDTKEDGNRGPWAVAQTHPCHIQQEEL